MFGNKNRLRIPATIKTQLPEEAERLAARQREALEKVKQTSPLHIPVRKLGQGRF